MGSWRNHVTISRNLLKLPTSLLALGLLGVILLVIARMLPTFMFVLTVLAVLYVAWRTWVTVQKDVERLQLTISELEAKTRALERARAANTLSVKERSRRTKQVEELKKHVKEAEEMCESLRAERDKFEEEVESLSQERGEYKQKAEEYENRCRRLGKELEQALFIRWKLTSRIHGDEKARIAAVNKLRRPRTHYQIDGLDNWSNQSLPSPKRMRSPRAVSPDISSSKLVSKSPSESYLLDLHPDIGISDSDIDDDELDEPMPMLSLSSTPMQNGYGPSNGLSTPETSERSRGDFGNRESTQCIESHTKEQEQQLEKEEEEGKEEMKKAGLETEKRLQDYEEATISADVESIENPERSETPDSNNKDEDVDEIQERKPDRFATPRRPPRMLSTSPLSLSKSPWAIPNSQRGLSSLLETRPNTKRSASFSGAIESLTGAEKI